MLATKDPCLSQAALKLREISADDKLRIQCEQREKAIRDYESSMIAASRRGRQEGMKKGMEEGMEEGMKEGMLQVAINLWKAGADPSLISSCTGLSIAEIEALNQAYLLPVPATQNPINCEFPV